MYNSQLLSSRIRTIVKEKGIVQKEMLKFCDLNENSLNQMSDKKGLSSFSLAKIADYLDCSVDYLLGRDSYASNGNSINTGDIHGDHNATITTSEQNSEIEKEISSILSGLNFREKTELMAVIYKFVDEHKK